MLKNKIKTGVRTLVALLLAAAMLMALCACNTGSKNAPDALLEYKGESIPASFYSLLLSRMKGSLSVSGYDVRSAEFWSETVEGTTLTYEEYFNASVLESCKNYLCALVLFGEAGLTLPASVKAEIEEEIEFYISLGYIGGGDVEKFNALIEKYGVDADSLKVAYEIEAKYSYLLSYLYGSDASLVRATVKEEFYEDNYYRFKQILLPNFYYLYETDEFGGEIYFDEESGRRLYDDENGSVRYDENGSRIKDKNGDTIYFDDEGNILYDKVNGKRSVILDENGEAKQYAYTDAEIAERGEQAREILALLASCDEATFEAKMAEYNVSYGESESYPDGYYLSRVESAGYSDYMLEMLEALEAADVGDTLLVESEYGYHVIMKYALDEGKYADGNYAEWFAAFNDSLISELFAEKCAPIKANITVNEENVKSAESIRTIGANTDY